MEKESWIVGMDIKAAGAVESEEEGREGRKEGQTSGCNGDSWQDWMQWNGREFCLCYHFASWAPWQPAATTQSPWICTYQLLHFFAKKDLVLPPCQCTYSLWCWPQHDARDSAGLQHWREKMEESWRREHRVVHMIKCKSTQSVKWTWPSWSPNWVL